ncbi:RNA-binding protein NOB1-like [Actinia tenebrosa]|uniref:RNA-binding protein NOB1 n=1 Tax=Actinia tenebrosa TaxID=6105 RepID=A0A6P8IA17_ACTTE|nr:RNA-binding protein NOB1-like [Actinia tenebrosa]
MATNAKGNVKHLVVDSAGFIRNIELLTLGERIYTIKEVVQEIRDAATRQRLSVLPYELIFRQPSTEAIKAVTDFAKLTGDFKVLSAVDLKVLALTYQLEKEFCGIEHLKTKPTQQVQISKGQNLHKIPGFYTEKNDPSAPSNNDAEMSESQAAEGDGEGDDDDPVGSDSGKTLEDEIEEISTLPGCSISEQQQQLGLSSTAGNVTEVSRNLPQDSVRSSSTSGKSLQVIPPNQQAAVAPEAMDVQEVNNQADDLGEDEGFVEEDEEGWITPENIRAIQDEMGHNRLDASPANVEVGCLTTDFSMQNVLIQMGLHVVSVDGMLIREARSYVLKCHACFRVTHQLQKVFCPWCGNKTLKRVTMTIDENGVTHYNMSNRKRPFNIRGKKHPLPLPQGGRFADNPVLVEDQPGGQRRLPSKRDKVDAMDPDFVARSSPFSSHDINSRAVQHGFHVKERNWNRRNPNEVVKNSRRSKKK